MDESILDTIKKEIGLDPMYEAFDSRMITLINSFIMSLRQLGVGPQDGFSIVDNTTTWRDYLGDQLNLLLGVKTYIAERTRIAFDTPNNNTQQALNQIISEMEFRLRLESGF